MYAQVDKDRAGSVNKSTDTELYAQVKRQPGASVRAANHDHRSASHEPRSNGNGSAQSPPPPASAPGNHGNQQQTKDFDGLYAKVQKMPSLDGAQKRPTNGVEGHAVTSPSEGVGPDTSYQSIDEVMNDDNHDVINGGAGGPAAGMVHISHHSGSQHKWKRKEHTYQAVDGKNPKKGKKEKKEKKEKKDKNVDHQNNRTPSPQPQTNPWQPRFPQQQQNSGYEHVNVNSAPTLQGVDNANKRGRSRTNSRETGRVINDVLNHHDSRMRSNSAQDSRKRSDSREQMVRTNGTAPSIPRTSSREQGVVIVNRIAATQDGTKIITSPQENGNNNGNQQEFFWAGVVQETRL